MKMNENHINRDSYLITSFRTIYSIFFVSSILSSNSSYWVDQSLPSLLYSILMLLRSLSSWTESPSIFLWNCPTRMNEDPQMLSTTELIIFFSTFSLLSLLLFLMVSSFISQGRMTLYILIFSISSEKQLISDKLWILMRDSRKLLYFLSSSGITKC